MTDVWLVSLAGFVAGFAVAWAVGTFAARPPERSTGPARYDTFIQDRCRDMGCPDDYVEFVSAIGDAQGVIRVPRDRAHLFAVPDGWAPRVEVTSP